MIPFKNVTEAVKTANDSMYGLAASLWTNDPDTAHKTARDLQSGVVWIHLGS